MAILSFDVGGTSLRYRLVQRGQVLSGGGKVATPKGTPADFVRSVVDISRQFTAVDAIGISFCGATNKEGVVLGAPNLWGPAHAHVQLAKMINEATGIKTVVVNDMTAAAFREAHYGAGKDLSSFFIVTVSSGVGSKLYRDGNIVQGEDGVTGEIGHFVMDPGSEIQCGCGGYGHLESLASGIAAERIVRQLAPGTRYPLINSFLSLFYRNPLFKLSNGDPNSITNNMLATAASQGDKFALMTLAQVAMPLALGINHVWAMSKPERVIIIGGFALNMGEPYFAALRKSLIKTGLFGIKDLTDEFLSRLIIRGTDDDNSGIIGAAAAAEAMLNNHPA